eukprot:876783-Ditylum_brightwellii.AAC.1
MAKTSKMQIGEETAKDTNEMTDQDSIVTYHHKCQPWSPWAFNFGCAVEKKRGSLRVKAR